MRSHPSVPLIFLSLLLTPAPRLAATHAHLNYPDWWQPAYESAIITSPAPPRQAERMHVFAQRNSPEEMTRLAKEFFRLIDARRVRLKTAPLQNDAMGLNEKREGYRGSKTQKADLETLLKEEKYEEALTLYRDFFFERLLDPPPGFALAPAHPMERQFVEFIHQPDELLENLARLTMLDDKGKGVVVRLDMGAPGRVNWTWFPPQFETYDPLVFARDGTFMTKAVKYPTFHNALLKAYLETGESRYLSKWCDFADDRSLNLARDCDEAGLSGAPVDHMSLASGLRLFGTFRYVAQHSDRFAREFPAPTLARLLIDLWKNVPTNIRMAREVSTNRSIEMYSQPYFDLAISFPEFEASPYLLREKMRITESYTTVTMMADGSDIENSEGYNTAYLRNTDEVLSSLKATHWAGVPWITPDWLQELERNRALRMSYLIQHKQNNGWEWYPNYYTNRYASKYAGKRPEFFDLSPTAFVDARNRGVLSAIWGAGATPPGERSNAWPYSGQFLIREHWGKDAQTLYMDSPRPYNSHTWKNANDIQLFAFGQPLLTLHTEGYGFRRSGYAEDPVFSEWEEGYRQELRKKYNNPAMRGLHQWEFTPIFVDNLPQLGHEAFQKQPLEYRSRPEPMYGKMNAMAYQTPIPNRWHDSDRFSLAEGTYNGPFASVDGARRIDGVRHHRQVFFVREAKLWVVVDRISASDGEVHNFKLDWKPAQPFESDKKQIPGFTPEQILSDQKTRTIRTANPTTANISISMHSRAALQLYSTGAEFQGSGEQLVVSLLYPRREIGTDLKTVTTFEELPEATGFSAETPEGTLVSFAAAQTGKEGPARAPLALGDLKVEAEALLVVRTPDGKTSGVVLGSPKTSGAAQPDYEFTVRNSHIALTSPIHRPMERVDILPAANVFTETAEVTLSHPEDDVEIRYTLDGTDPTLASPLYTGPLMLKEDTVVMATAFRKGLTTAPLTTASTQASVPMRAHFLRRPLRAAENVSPGKKSGLHYDTLRGDWSLGAIWSKPKEYEESGGVRNLFEFPTQTPGGDRNGARLWNYTGFIDIPADGIYTFHAPREMTTPTQDAGYDLRLWIGHEEWYPSTRWHNFGGWSVPLAKGRHPLRVLYTDQRGSSMRHRDDGFNVWRGKSPTLEISGPNLERQPIPATWLFH